LPTLTEAIKAGRMVKHYPPKAEIEISAPIQQVWDVLLDGASYPDWNAFIVKVEGDLRQVGVNIPMEVKLGERTVRPSMKVVTVEPPAVAGPGARWIHQYDSFLARTGWLTSERHHEMSPIKGGAATLYKTWEPFGGWLKLFVPFKQIDEGFKAQAEQLKARVEALPLSK